MQPSKPPPAAAAEHPASAAGTTNQQQQGAQVPVGGAEALVQGQTAPPLAVPVPGAAVAVPNATSASNADHSGSASGQQMPATVLSSSREPVWQKCAGQGRWRLVQQHSSGRLQAAVLAAEASNASGEDDEAMTSSTHGITSAAANAALVDELASAAKGLLPQLQSRGDGFGAVAANAQAGARGEAAVLGLEEQMQAVTAHSARLLKVLCSVLQPEVSWVFTTCCISAQSESTRLSVCAISAVSSTRLHVCGLLICTGRSQNDRRHTLHQAKTLAAQSFAHPCGLLAQWFSQVVLPPCYDTGGSDLSRPRSMESVSTGSRSQDHVQRPGADLGLHGQAAAAAGKRAGSQTGSCCS